MEIFRIVSEVFPIINENKDSLDLRYMAPYHIWLKQYEDKNVFSFMQRFQGIMDEKQKQEICNTEQKKPIDPTVPDFYAILEIEFEKETQSFMQSHLKY